MRLNFLLDKDWLDLKEQSIIASNENSYVTFKCRDILQLLVTWLFSLFKNLEDLGELYKNRYYFIIVYYICSEYIFYTVTIIKKYFFV
ncbi:hypothetical protein BGU65_16390 [Clostridioides difficile]|nr:hypothetical protein CWR54_10465 [Clostridioides difficile]OFU14530.1 hypothetical protein HMPREF3080_03565 [Clostridium sp. HMSC19C11]OFU28327.1 hypothetical protein HMPREF3076_10980 [Clostridium sp. HMSC19B12]AYD23294.1 hypothetical protein DA434_11230 [Clostridioides difficile]EAA0001904.1 hypothetical protein [Clostridioides difficile]